MKKQTLTYLAVERLKQISAGDFSSEVREKALSCLLDFLGAAQSGLLTQLSNSILKYAELHADKPEAYVFGSDRAMCAETAAFTNTVLAHSVARDDMHLDSCSHMGSMVVSTSLALAQRDKWTGEQLIRAIVGGHEIGALLGTTIRGGGTFNTHFRASGLIGAFAAAGAAIAASFTTEEEAVNALALAVNMASGINAWAWAGGSEIYIHNGIASRAGITSYDLAYSGVHASDTVLEGRDGFFEAINAGSGAADLFRTWVETYSIGKGILDVNFKPAAGCNFTQTSSAIALKISSKHKIDNVESVKVMTTTAAISYPGCDNLGPLESKSHGKLSIQYGVCAALIFGRLDEETFSCIDDERVNSLMKRCLLVADPDYDKEYAKGLQPATVEVVLKDGNMIREAAPDVPWLGAQEVATRFLHEISPCLSADKAEQLLQQYQKIEGFDFSSGPLSV
ncbi:hypothetical protein B7463_g11448, partial [Scytalidium lignicola]